MNTTDNSRPDLFGKVRMGYALVESEKTADWLRWGWMYRKPATRWSAVWTAMRGAW